MSVAYPAVVGQNIVIEVGSYQVSDVEIPNSE